VCFEECERRKDFLTSKLSGYDIIAIVDDKERMDLKEHLVGMFGTVKCESNDELS
jgi:hypothetical protein